MNTTLRRTLVALVLPLLVVGTATFTAPQHAAADDIDVYVTPGYQTIRGREWHTTCEKYSSTVGRCRTEIKATQVKLIKGRYVSTYGWVFNNLTYKAAPRSQWSNNNLGKTAAWTTNGRKWYTECDSPTTGYNGCRSYIWATHVVAKGSGYQQIQSWVFNNMVRFSNDAYGMYSGTGNGTVTLPKGATEVYVKGGPAAASSGRFSVRGLDSSGKETELAFDTSLQGQQGGGVIGLANRDTVKLQIKAAGYWGISVHPVSVAPKLKLWISEGTGSEALWYYGDPSTFTVSHIGGTNLVIREWVGGTSRVLVSKKGDYSGQVAFRGGPTLIQVEADGQWRIN